MGYLSERVSYLRGVIDGCALDKQSAQSRIFDAITELLEDIVMSVEGLDEKQERTDETLEDLVDQLDYLPFPDITGPGDYDDDEDEDYDGDEEDDEDFDDDDEDFDDDYPIEIFECPNCGEALPVDMDLFGDDDEVTVECPGCGEAVTITFEYDEDDEDDEGNPDEPDPCSQCDEDDCAHCPIGREE